MENYKYRIVERHYTNSKHIVYIPQYNNGGVNGEVYVNPKYDKYRINKTPFGELPDELFWFDFKEWIGSNLTPKYFSSFKGAKEVIDKHKLDSSYNTSMISKEKIHNL